MLTPMSFCAHSTGPQFIEIDAISELDVASQDNVDIGLCK